MERDRERCCGRTSTRTHGRGCGARTGADRPATGTRAVAAGSFASYGVAKFPDRTFTGKGHGPLWGRHSNPYLIGVAFSPHFSTVSGTLL